MLVGQWRGQSRKRLWLIWQCLSKSSFPFLFLYLLFFLVKSTMCTICILGSTPDASYETTKSHRSALLGTAGDNSAKIENRAALRIRNVIPTASTRNRQVGIGRKSLGDLRAPPWKILP